MATFQAYSGYSVSYIALIKHIAVQSNQRLIIGGQNATLARHTKPSSLDVWMRRQPNATAPDVRQTTKAAVAQILAFGDLELTQAPCPYTGRAVDTLVFKK